MSSWLLAAALLVAAPEFQATTLDGKSASGTLVELTAERAVLQTADGPATFELATIATLARVMGGDAAPKQGALKIELVDESSLAASQYTVSDGKASVTLLDGAKLEVPTKVIRSVRFGPPAGQEDTLARQWSEIAATRASGDLLVVRKSGQLDFLEGVARDVDDQRCNFEIDGEAIPVNREKIEGVLYFHPAAQDLPESAGTLGTIDGSNLAIHTVALADGTIKVATPAGIALELPAESISRFNFTAGKLAFLSDLSAESAKYVPYFGSKKEITALRVYYAFRRDVGFEQEPLQLDGKVYGKGLALQSRTVLVYKLPGKFRLFKAVVGIDDSVRRTGSANVEIKADGKSIWRAEVRGSDPPHELELDISGAKRLEIAADYGDDLDIGDRVNLCEAQVTK